MTTFIGLDLGTSFIKGAVLDLDRLTLQQVERLPFPSPLPDLPPLFHEVDPQRVVETVRRLLERLLAQAPQAEGIVMCSQMHGLVLTDTQGNPRSNFISWQDQRARRPHPVGGSYFDQLIAQLDPTLCQQLGDWLGPSFPFCCLYWLSENHRLPDQPVIPAALPDFVLANLGHTEPTIEATNAAAHGAMNLVNGSWHHQLIAQLGLDHLTWPAIQPFGQVVSRLELAGRTLPAYTPVGDHQCALVGALLEPSEISLNISTGSQVSRLTDTLRFGQYQIRPFFDGRYLNTVTRIPAGRALNLLVELLQELAVAGGAALPDPWQLITQAVSQVVETDLEIDLAFFAGVSGDRGSISNIREDNLSVGHLFRAAFRQMAATYHHYGTLLWPEQSWQRLVFSGGLVQKLAPLRETIVAQFQTAYRLSPNEEDTLFGLLALALVCSGQANTVAEAIRLLANAANENQLNHAP